MTSRDNHSWGCRPGQLRKVPDYTINQYTGGGLIPPYVPLLVLTLDWCRELGCVRTMVLSFGGLNVITGAAGNGTRMMQDPAPGGKVTTADLIELRQRKKQGSTRA